MSPPTPGDSGVPPDLAQHPRYHLVEWLGAGGMGSVYKAEHRLMQRLVALKIIHPHLVQWPDAVERFRREVRSAARLSHPNIVTAHDAEQAGQTHFLVMEFVEGLSLAQVIAERGPLPVALACDYARQVALGLQHAHERDMVHRDIKPHNLMLTPEGRVKILDFGLARLVMESGPLGEPAPAAGPVMVPVTASLPDQPKAVTVAGATVGTVDYIAPEQARNAHQADIRADVYSLGCTLYHFLVGHPPFPGGTAADKLAAHTQRTPKPLTELRKDLPPALARVVEKMMAKDPTRRYQTPGQMAEALAPFAGAPPRRGRGLFRSLLALALLLVLLPVAVALLRPDVYRYVANEGQIEITPEGQDVRVIVKQGGQPVRVIDTRTDRDIDLKAGTYQLELEGPSRQKLSTNQVTVTRGSWEAVRVTTPRWEPPRGNPFRPGGRGPGARRPERERPGDQGKSPAPNPEESPEEEP